MARVTVIGAGVGGLGSALMLSRAGHDVTVLERDATPLPSSPREAFAWDRRGAPQVRHSHAFLARLRNLLRDHHPDVLEALFAAGATEIRFADMLPPEITDRAPRPGDEDLVALACRRTTFEWVLRRVVLTDGRVTLVDGAAVTALEGGTDADLPTVHGVRYTVDGTERTSDADLVVVATGRRSALPDWLAPLGVELDETVGDTGIVYLSRFYELRDGVEPPEQDGPIGGDLGYVKYAVFQGDNRTFSITFASRSGDDEVRALLLDPTTFERAARLLPATSPWAQPELATPITDVFVMAGLVNRIRRFVVDGRPVVRALAAVGDAHTATNPLYGRGCSLAMVQAMLLTDAVAAHPDDPDAAAARYEEASGDEIEPWYHASVLADHQGALLAERERRERRGDDTADLDDDPGTMAGDVLRHGFMPAAGRDPDVFRAFVRMFNLLERPEAMFGDTAVMTTVLETYQTRDERPPPEPLGPPRREMVASLTAT